MKHLFRNSLVVMMGIALGGCEWGGSSDSNSWNDSQSIANFSGSYQANGNYLVSAYTSTNGSSSSTSAGEENILNENHGVVESPSFGGVCYKTPIKKGSVTLFLGGAANGQFRDNGSGVLSGTFSTLDGLTFSASGTIDYDNGAYAMNLGVIAGDATVGILGSPITITYTRLTGSSGSTTTFSGEPGSSGGSIYSFNVQQSGNKLSIIDNNGCVYSGSMGEVKTTGNVGANSAGYTFVNGDQIVATYYAAGKSKSGMHVNMTGNFQGTVAGVSSVTEVSGDTVTVKTSYALTDRVMLGTWIEDGGQTGDIKGKSFTSGSVSFSSSTSTNSP